MKRSNVFSILKNPGSKKHEFRQTGTGVPASRNRSSSEIAGIGAYSPHIDHLLSIRKQAVQPLPYPYTDLGA
jgi:hypothetical protein